MIVEPGEQLTAKGIQVATLVWDGLTNREIAKVIETTQQVGQTICPPRSTNRDQRRLEPACRLPARVVSKGIGVGSPRSRMPNRWPATACRFAS